MSNYLSIAAVTMTLRDILLTSAQEAISSTTVTTNRPEKISNGNQDKAAINIYLYQVAPNAAWRNSDLIFRFQDKNEPQNRARDTIEQRPLVPINLYYLLSFYGDERKLEPQILLGRSVSALQAQPRLLPDNIRAALKNNKFLRDDRLPNESYLDFQVEHIDRVSLSPLSLSLEELSKLWSVFFQVPYALSVAYEAAVVLIEPSPPRPLSQVGEDGIQITPLLGPSETPLPETARRVNEKLVERAQGDAHTSVRDALKDLIS